MKTPTIYTVIAESADWDCSPDGSSRIHVQRGVVGHYASLAYAYRKADEVARYADSVSVESNRPDTIVPYIFDDECPF